MCPSDRFEKEEQDLIDQIVSRVSENAAITEAEIEGLINAWGGDISSETDWISDGIYLELIESELNDEELSGYEGLDLGSIDDAVRIQYARDALVRACVDNNADVVPGFRGGVVVARDGSDAFVVFAVQGYSFSGISEDFYGAFASETAFREHVKSDGYILTDGIQSSADTKKWITDAQILGAWQRT